MKSAEKWGMSYPMKSLIRNVQRDVLDEVVRVLQVRAGEFHEDEKASNALLDAARKFGERIEELP